MIVLKNEYIYIIYSLFFLNNILYSLNVNEFVKNKCEKKGCMHLTKLEKPRTQAQIPKLENWAVILLNLGRFILSLSHTHWRKTNNF